MKAQHNLPASVQLDWPHFEEHLKQNVPWVVYTKIEVKGGIYLNDSLSKKVMIKDLQKWEDEKKIYIIKKMDKSIEKMQAIFLRPQFPEEVIVEAEFVPQKFRKDLKENDSSNWELKEIRNVGTHQKKELAIGLSGILKRPTDSLKEVNTTQKNQETETAQNKIENDFMFKNNQNQELKKKFYTAFAIFDKENK